MADVSADEFLPATKCVLVELYVPNLIIRFDWHMSSLMFESVRLGRFVIGSTCCSIRPGLSNRKAKDRLRFIRGTFLCAESNAYITNTVTKLVLIT